MLFVVALFAIIFSYFRTFSKNMEKRRAENAKYLKFKSGITDWFKLRREMWQQRREYKFFKCPSCKAVLRVPRGKGKIRVVCKKCGNAFEKKT
ncbi:MAG: zinc ribbon domain-containing protein [Oscillospiraceae bacterium]